MSVFYVTWGPDHVTTKGSHVYSFCNSHWPKIEEKSEEAAEEDASQHEGYRDPGGTGTTAAKD